MNHTLSFKFELQRKAIHLSSALIPLLYYFSHQRSLIQAICLILAVGFLTADILRLKFALVRKLFLNIFGKLLRDKEVKNRITGATFLCSGMALTVFLFQEKQAVPALLFASIADPVAAIAGRAWGENKFFEKSLEGSAGFYLAAAAIILLFTNYSWWGLVVAIIVTVAELLPLGIDDNLLVPVLTAYLLSLG